MRLRLHRSPVRIGHRNVIPCVDVNLLYLRVLQIGGQDGIPRHIVHEPSEKYFPRHARHRIAGIRQKLFEVDRKIPRAVGVGQQRGIGFGNMCLRQLQQLRVRHRQSRLFHSIHHSAHSASFRTAR